MAGDFERIASVYGDLRVVEARAGFVTPTKFKRGKRLFGSVIGPPKARIHYEVSCDMPSDGGRSCSNYVIERSGPGADGLKKRASVGNEHGLKRQMARDAARVWDCPPGYDRGFEGSRPRRRSRRPRR